MVIQKTYAEHSFVRRALLFTRARPPPDKSHAESKDDCEDRKEVFLQDPCPHEARDK